MIRARRTCRFVGGRQTPRRLPVDCGVAQVCVILTLVLFGWRVTGACAQNSSPALRAEPAELDLGVASDEAPLRGRVWIENTAAEAVVLSVAATSCGCTVGRLSEGRLESGQGEWLDVTVTPKGKTGDVRQTVVLRASGHSEDVVVRVRAKIVPIVEYQPRDVRLGAAGGPRDATIVITGDHPEFRVLTVRCAGFPGTAQVSKSTPACGSSRASAEILVRLTEASPGPGSGSIEIATNDPRRPLISVPVRVGVQSSRGTGPAVLTLIPPAPDAIGSILIPANKERPQIKGVRDLDRPAAEVTWKLVQQGGLWRLDISVPWDLRSDTSVGTLAVARGDQEQPIRIPFRVNVRPAVQGGANKSPTSHAPGGTQ
jgi:hypothetical protein